MNIFETLRFFIALWASKSVWWLMKLLKRNATHFPGDVAIKLDPHFLKHIAKPKTIIMVTGTNGKTSVTNMILDVFKKNNVVVTHNALGSNILQGIATSILSSTSILNQPHNTMAVLEIDERSSRLIMPFVKPNYLIVNNLFRDSYRRNAHVEFIVSILKQTIPSTTHVIVNGDDMFASSLIEQRSHTVFSLQPISDEVSRSDSRIHDALWCPVCTHPMSFSFIRHHHLSHYQCPHCQLTNPVSHVVAMMSSQHNHHLHIHVQGQTHVINRLHPSVIDAYNVAAVMGLFSAMKQDLSSTATVLSSIQTVASRFNETIIHGKRVIGLLAKDQNPVAISRMCDFLSTKAEWGRLGLCFMNEVFAHDPNPSEVENMAYLYDTDFEYLNECTITQIIMGGHRRYELKTRLLLAGLATDTMVIVEREDDEINAIDLDLVDTIVLVYSTKNIPQARSLTQKLIDRIQREVSA